MADQSFDIVSEVDFQEVKNAAKAYRESWNRTADPFVGKLRDVAEGAVGAAEGIFDRLGRRSSAPPS